MLERKNLNSFSLRLKFNMVLNVFFCKCIEKFICIVIFFSKKHEQLSQKSLFLRNNFSLY